MAEGKSDSWSRLLSAAAVRVRTRPPALPFIAADAISLVNPDRFYAVLLKPSLGALFVSQIIVFVVFPRYRRGAVAIGVATVASSLAAWGLYVLVAGGAST